MLTRKENQTLEYLKSNVWVLFILMSLEDFQL